MSFCCPGWPRTGCIGPGMVAYAVIPTQTSNAITQGRASSLTGDNLDCHLIKDFNVMRAQWHTPVILAIWDADHRRIT